jgi:hypothetical protein
MTSDYSEEIAELKRIQDRLRTLRGRLCDTARKENKRYHAFSGAVAHLNRVIEDLAAEEASSRAT